MTTHSVLQIFYSSQSRIQALTFKASDLKPQMLTNSHVRFNDC